MARRSLHIILVDSLPNIKHPISHSVQGLYYNTRIFSLSEVPFSQNHPKDGEYVFLVCSNITILIVKKTAFYFFFFFFIIFLFVNVLNLLNL